MTIQCTHKHYDYDLHGYYCPCGQRMQKLVTAQRDVYWCGDVPATDDFGVQIAFEFIDGRTAEGGHWAIMTPISWQLHGCGLFGEGYGQVYVRTPHGQWIKVKG